VARKKISREIEFDWDEAKLHEFIHDPSGPVGAELLTACGEVVLKGAKRRALRSTGRMQAAMYARVVEDDGELTAVIVSPATDPRSHNFPYAVVHEGSKVRDRRPHRSLRPALRDIRHLQIIDPGQGSAP
jgi:hypothetical protein